MTSFLTAYLAAFTLNLLALFPQDSTISQGQKPDLDSVAQNIESKGYWVADSTLQLEVDSICFAVYDSIQRRLPDTLDIKRAKRRILREYKDSVRIATPRIIESFALPDSLKYKRIISWVADTKFNEVDFREIEQKYNHHFNDYPIYKKDANANYLGTIGSPAQEHNYFKRESTGTFDAADPLLVYSYTPESIPYYNTKNPYTELAYWGTPFALQQKEELECKVLTTQNITPAFNFCLAFEKFGSNGMLANEETDNRTLRINLNYLGKKYLLHGGYMQQRAARGENGGIRDTRWITDTVVDPKEIQVYMNNAGSNFARRTLFLDHNLAIPLNFFRKDRDSLKAGEGTTAYIGHSMEMSWYKRAYYDEISSSDTEARSMYLDKFYINPTHSSDSIALRDINNRVFIKLQPYDENAVLSKIDAGIGFRHRSYYRFSPEQYYEGPYNSSTSDFYIYAGASGQFRKYLKWNADGQYNIAGYCATDYSIGGQLRLSFYPVEQGMHLTAKFRLSGNTPNLFEQKIYFNHHRWENDFTKTNEMRIEGEFTVPKWKLKAMVGYSVSDGKIYYDSESMIRQASEPVNIFTAVLEKDFKLGILHLDHRLLYQISSNQDVVPLPTFSANLKYYLEFTVVKEAMDMQLGVNGTFYTKYRLPGYMPDLGVFYNQNEEELGGNPLFDIFVNCQWKKVCVFLKYTNFLREWPGKDHFSAYRYIRPEGTIKLGVFWPF